MTPKQKKQFDDIWLFIKDKIKKSDINVLKSYKKNQEWDKLINYASWIVIKITDGTYD